MSRREFLVGAASSVALPLLSNAQGAAVPLAGYLSIRPPDADAPYVSAFREGLKDSGFVEDQNVTLLISSAENRSDRLPGLARDLIDRNVAVIAAGGTVTARAAQTATSRIPIVFVTADDPIENGLVTQLNRPAANLTGVSMVSAELRPKMLEMLHEVVPSMKVVFKLANPDNSKMEIQLNQTKAAAEKIGLQFKVLEAANSEDLDAVFATLQGTDAGLLVNSDPYFTGQRAKIVALAARQRIPAIYPWREYVDEGGMMSYGSDNIQAYRIAGNYAGRLIKGAKVQDLPVWQANKLSLVLNLKGASGVGVKFPAHMIALADDVIE